MNTKKLAGLVCGAMLVMSFVTAAFASEETIDRTMGVRPGTWDQKAEFRKGLDAMQLGNPVEGVEAVSFTMSTHCSETDSNYLYALAFQKAVDKLSGGKMSVNVYASGQLFGQADALQAIQQGTLDIANSDTALLANYNPAAGILDIPFLFAKLRKAAVKLLPELVIRKQHCLRQEDQKSIGYAVHFEI